MKRILALSVALVLAACSTQPGQPAQDPVEVIKQACADDAALRPAVSQLLAVPGLASTQAVAAVTAARVVIDGVCAAPTASDRARLIQATASVVAVYAQLQAAKAASAPG